MTALSPVTRRLLAVAILIALVLGLWTLVVGPLAARHGHYDDQISQARELLIRYRNIIQTEQRLAKKHVRIRGNR